MIWVACYDISDGKLRTTASNMLMSFGFERIQRSVFLCHEPDFEDLLAELQKIRERLGDEDLLVILPLCANCEKSAVWVSGKPPAKPPTFKII